MEITAKTRTTRIAPRKARLVIGLVKGMSAKFAIDELLELPKKSSVIVLKLLKSAIASAKHNYNIDLEDLFISKAFVDQGPTLKRWRPRAFGRVAAIRKKTSHITIVLSQNIEDKKSSVKKDEAKKSTSKENEVKPKDKIAKNADKKPVSSAKKDNLKDTGKK